MPWIWILVAFLCNMAYSEVNLLLPTTTAGLLSGSLDPQVLIDAIWFYVAYTIVLCADTALRCPAQHFAARNARRTLWKRMLNIRMDYYFENNPSNLLKQLDDDSLWRYDTSMNVYVNSAMLMDLHGVSYFFSLNNGYISQWMGEMGYCSATEFDYVGLQGRSLLDYLLGVKYFLCGTDSTSTLPQGYKTEPALAMDVAGVNVGAYEKSDALPIGYTSAARISRSDYDALTPVQRQDALLNGVLLEDGDGEDLAAAESRSDVIFPAAQVTLNGIEMVDENTYYSPQDGGTITFTISQPVTDCET